MESCVNLFLFHCPILFFISLLHPTIIAVPSIHSLTHGAEPFLRSCQLCSYTRTSQHFMEPGGSSPHSHKPSTGPYPGPDRSNPHRLFSLLNYDISEMKPCANATSRGSPRSMKKQTFRVVAVPCFTVRCYPLLICLATVSRGVSLHSRH
jgi:hypothetical protein